MGVVYRCRKPGRKQKESKSQHILTLHPNPGKRLNYICTGDAQRIPQQE
jgi:hypothetical protein